jgi:DNA recombination protein RmuC
MDTGQMISVASDAAGATLVLCVAVLAAVIYVLVMLHRRGANTEQLARQVDELRNSLANLQSHLAERIAQSSGDLREKVVERLASGFDGVGRRISDDLTRGRQEQLGQLDKAITELQGRFEQLQQATQVKLTEIRGEVEKKLTETVDQNLKNFSAVTEKLTLLHEAAGQMVSLSKNVGDLKTILQSPKARGAFGEMTLENMLAELFGADTEIYATQYELDSRERVDAAIFIEPGRRCCVCIDAKFPLSNAQPLLDGQLPESELKAMERAFARDVVARAQEIAGKYIRPPGTLDFAFMFVPAESVYYLLLRNSELHEQLLSMRVVPTSPNAFYAYLRAMAYAFRGRKLQHEARHVLTLIEQIAKDFSVFSEDFRVLGKHLSNAKSKWDEAAQEMDRFSERITGVRRIEVDGKPAEAPTILRLTGDGTGNG